MKYIFLLAIFELNILIYTYEGIALFLIFLILGFTNHNILRISIRCFTFIWISFVIFLYNKSIQLENYKLTHNILIQFLFLFKMLLEIFDSNSYPFLIFISLQNQAFIFVKIGYHYSLNHIIYLYLIWQYRSYIDGYNIIAGLILVIVSTLFLFIFKKDNSQQQNFKSVRSQRSNKSQKSERSKVQKADSFRSHLEQLDEQKNQNINVKDKLLIEMSQSKKEEDISKQSESFNEDEQLLKEQQYSWIYGQKYLVLDEEEQIIYQSFQIDMQSEYNDKDYVNELFSIPIQSGNRDLYELIYFQELHEDKTHDINNSFIAYEDYPQYLLREQLNLQQITKIIFSNYEKYKKSLFIGYKLDSPFNEYKNICLKIFITRKNQKNYIFINIDQLVQVNNKLFLNQQKLVHSVFNILSSSISIYINCILTMTQLAELEHNTDHNLYEKFLFPIRTSTIQIYLNLANFRDYDLFLRNNLLLKITRFSIQDTISDIVILLQEEAEARKLEIKIDFDLCELSEVQNDNERFKQIFHSLLQFIIRNSQNGHIQVSIQQVTSNNLCFQIKPFCDFIEDKDFTLIHSKIKKYSVSASLSIIELQHKGIQEEHPLIVANILAKKISGFMKKGIEQAKTSKGFQFYLESFPSEQQSEYLAKLQIFDQTRYYENSLSQHFRSNGTHSGSKPFQEQSQSIMSKQQSFKISDYYSQVSKIYQNSKQSNSHNNVSFKNISMSFQRLSQKSESQGNGSQFDPQGNNTKILYNLVDIPGGGNDTFHQFSNKNRKSQREIQRSDNQLERVSEKNLADENYISQSKQQSKTTVDFGSDLNSFINISAPYMLEAKLLKSVIKYKIDSKCCSKVLVVDNQYLTIQMLSRILIYQKIKHEKCYSLEDAEILIEQKRNKACSNCSNNSFLLFFISLDLPGETGILLTKSIKENMKNGNIDKAYIIGNTGILDIQRKILFYEHGMDHYITLPIDVTEIQYIINFLQF